MDIRQLHGTRPTGRQGRTVASGYLSLNQPAPTSFDDPISVIVPSHSAQLPILFTYWPRCHGDTLPAAGNTCVIVYDERGVPFCTYWEPSNYLEAA